MAEAFPKIDEEIVVETATTNLLQKPNVKLVCEKHGEIPDEYVFRVHMPDHGYDRKTYCLVCAIDYLSMIAAEVEYVPLEESNNE
jgi:hypothetical protein